MPSFTFIHLCYEKAEVKKKKQLLTAGKLKGKKKGRAGGQERKKYLSVDLAV